MSAEDRSRHSRGLRGTEQIWLPGLQVWAALGSNRVDRSAKSLLQLRSNETASPRELPATLDMQTSLTLRSQVASATEAPLKAAALASDCKAVGTEAVPNCPICLTDITNPADKAVVSSCMHVFCVECISRWAARKRVCPLCKGRIHGYLYNIQNDADYSERVIPPSPERPASPTYQPPRASRWGPNPSPAASYLDLFPSPSYPANPSQADQGTLQRWQHTAQHYFGSSSQQLNSGFGSTATIRPSQSSRQNQASTAAVPREPRPYYYRVQQQMQAGSVNHSQHSGPRNEAAPVDASLAWRRNIYTDSMWAVATGPQASAMPNLMSQAPNRARRLQDWVTRELQALLDQQDVSIVRSFVMSLANSHGLNRPQGVLSQSGASAARLATTLNALRPFLHERTHHFWHELRCFAESPYSMAAYDRVIQYQRRAPAASQVAEQDQQQPQYAEQHAQQPQQAAQHAEHAQRARPHLTWADWALAAQSNPPPAPLDAPPAPLGAPPAPLDGPQIRPQPSSPVMIDLTADSDASLASPSSSSDFQIVTAHAPRSASAASSWEGVDVSSPVTGPVDRSRNAFWQQPAARQAGRDIAAAPYRARRRSAANCQEGAAASAPSTGPVPDQATEHISSRHSSASADARRHPAHPRGAVLGTQHDAAAKSGAWMTDSSEDRQEVKPAKRSRWDVLPDHMTSIGRGAGQGTGRGQEVQEGQGPSQLDCHQPSGFTDAHQGQAEALQPHLDLRQGYAVHGGPWSSADLEGTHTEYELSVSARRRGKKRRRDAAVGDLEAGTGQQDRYSRRERSTGRSMAGNSGKDTAVDQLDRTSHRHRHKHRSRSRSRDRLSHSGVKKRHKEVPDAWKAFSDQRDAKLLTGAQGFCRSCSQSELQDPSSHASSIAASVNDHQTDSGSDRWQLWHPGMDV